MTESLKLANSLETIAIKSRDSKDWENAKKAIDLAWSLHKRNTQIRNSPESDIEYARR